jgi:hypothetical protein
MTDNEIYKSINAVSQKVNSILKQLDTFTLQKHQENKDVIDENQTGVVEVAEVAAEEDSALAEIANLLSEQNEAICELAEIITSLKEE